MSTAAASITAADDLGTRSAPGWVVLWHVELTKMFAQLRVRVVLAGCLLVPIVVAAGLTVSNFAPGDTVLGIYIHESGFAFSLVILNWVGIWALPLCVAIVAGDICSEEHRLGTWPLLVTRSFSRGSVLAGKMLAAATYTAAVTLLAGMMTTVVGLIAVGHQPLVSLSGSMLSPHAALLATVGSWVSELAPMLAIAAIALLVSVLSRNSWVGVIITVALVLLLNLVGYVSSIDSVRPILPTTGLEAWHGLVRTGVYMDQIRTSVVVSLAWIALCFGIAAAVFLQRDVADS